MSNTGGASQGHMPRPDESRQQSLNQTTAN